MGSGAKASLWESNKIRIVCITWEGEGPRLPEARTPGWRAQVSCVEEMRPCGTLGVLACAHCGGSVGHVTGGVNWGGQESGMGPATQISCLKTARVWAFIQPPVVKRELGGRGWEQKKM